MFTNIDGVLDGQKLADPALTRIGLNIVMRLMEIDGILQIDNGKQLLQPLNIVHFEWLPSSTPYGNLGLKGMNIVRRIDRVNVEIRRVFTSYVHPSNQDVNNRVLS